MRETAVHAALVAAIEGATLDTDVGGEEFRHIDQGGAHGGVLTEWSFLLRWMGTVELPTNNQRTPEATYELEIFYAQSPYVARRMAADAERIGGALWGLHTSQPDICAVMVGRFEPGESPDVEGMNSTIVSVVVKYQLTNGV